MAHNSQDAAGKHRAGWMYHAEWMSYLAASGRIVYIQRPMAPGGRRDRKTQSPRSFPFIQPLEHRRRRNIREQATLKNVDVLAISRNQAQIRLWRVGPNGGVAVEFQSGKQNLTFGSASIQLTMCLMTSLGLAKAAIGFPAQHPLKSPDKIAPSGTIIPLRLENTIDSKNAYEGESVYCETIFPVALDNHMLIPAHSYVKGHVTAVDQPGHIIGRAQLSIKMDTLTLPNGKTWPIRARVYSLAGARLSSKKPGGNNGDTGGGQTLKSPGPEESIIDSSGLPGATSLSAASEGVGGLILLLVTRGKRIVLRPGTTMEIQLSEPLNFTLPPPPLPKRKPPTLERRPSSHAQ